TKNAMTSNLVRTSAFVAVLIVAASGRPLFWIAACGFAGELLALGVCLWGLRRKHHISASLCAVPCSVVGAGMFIAAGVQNFGLTNWSGSVAILTSGILVAIVSG